MRRALFVTAAAALLAVPLARANGDPASDVLLTQPVYFPIDATLQDTPIASYYAPRFPELKRIGDPVAPGYYVAYFRKGEGALGRALNEALVLMLRNGEIVRIYRK